MQAQLDTTIMHLSEVTKLTYLNKANGKLKLTPSSSLGTLILKLYKNVPWLSPKSTSKYFFCKTTDLKLFFLLG